MPLGRPGCVRPQGCPQPHIPAAHPRPTELPLPHVWTTQSSRAGFWWMQRVDGQAGPGLACDPQLPRRALSEARATPAAFLGAVSLRGTTHPLPRAAEGLRS